ncbi:hypothetical protein BpHYR1_046945 [Brachionus plicatilis]|uniref:Uncharacterized protein n=1 Tax=Brachionus plicatilis TaxID=10195 RepID=A0A3M7RG62_BRAPC|nr:hypothetical protein BpHYR1_046945 [Brachionus plicatilis]
MRQDLELKFNFQFIKSGLVLRIGKIGLLLENGTTDLDAKCKSSIFKISAFENSNKQSLGFDEITIL